MHDHIYGQEQMTCMMNTKSLWAWMAVISLLVMGIGLMRFTIDFWVYFQPANAKVPLNYRGIGGALSGAAMLSLFLFLYFRKKE